MGSYAVGFRLQGVLISESSVCAKRFQRPPTLLTARRLESYTFWRACRDFVGDCKRAVAVFKRRYSRLQSHAYSAHEIAIGCAKP